MKPRLLDLLKDSCYRAYVAGGSPTGWSQWWAFHGPGIIAAHDAALEGEAEGGHKLDKLSWEGGYIAACCDLRGSVTPDNDAAVKLFAERSWKATGADRAPSEHPEQSVEPGEKESNTTTSAEHPETGEHEELTDAVLGEGGSTEGPPRPEEGGSAEPLEALREDADEAGRLETDLWEVADALGLETIPGEPRLPERVAAVVAEVERLREARRQILDLRDTEWATGPSDMDQRYVAGVYAGKLEKIWQVALAASPDTPTQVGSEDAGAKGTSEELGLGDEGGER